MDLVWRILQIKHAKQEAGRKTEPEKPGSRYVIKAAVAQVQVLFPFGFNQVFQTLGFSHNSTDRELANYGNQSHHHHI